MSLSSSRARYHYRRHGINGVPTTPATPPSSRIPPRPLDLASLPKCASFTDNGAGIAAEPGSLSDYLDVGVRRGWRIKVPGATDERNDVLVCLSHLAQETESRVDALENALCELFPASTDGGSRARPAQSESAVVCERLQDLIWRYRQDGMIGEDPVAAVKLGVERCKGALSTAGGEWRLWAELEGRLAEVGMINGAVDLGSGSVSCIS